MNRTLFVAAALATAALFGTTANAQTIGCEVGGTGGLIPASGTGGGGGTVFPTVLPPTPGVFTINVAAVPPGATVVTEVKFFGLTHTWLSDVQFVLTDPSGGQHNLWCRGTTGITSCDFNGDYTLVAPCTGAGQALPATCTGASILAPGTYDQFFGSANPWPSGTNNIFNTPLDSIPAATGVWTVTAYDWVGADTGALTSFDICFGTAQAPAAPTAAPTLTTPADNANVFGPNVNLVFGSVSCATSYEVEIDGNVFASASTTYAYGSSTQGAHTWRARGVNNSGVGPWSVTRNYNDLGPAPQPCNGPSVTTVPFLGGNGLGANSAVFFDVDVLNPAGITVSQLNINANAVAGTLFSLEIWTKPGTYVGFEQNSVPWTLVTTGAGIAVGNNVAPGALVEFTDFPLAQGVTGFALRILGVGQSYTNGNGTNQLFANADISISLGKGQATLFSSTPFSPRVWNGTLRYNCTSAPVVYCTAGTTTNGCNASITATAQPSVTFANPCVLNVANVEGQKQGLIFYGVNNTGFTPSVWGTGSTSFLCVKSPNQRTGTQTAGGTAGQCDGAFTLDWNAYQAANPGALGNPFSAGNKVYAQSWFRDPPAPKTTNLSDALEMTCQP
jgi:hypothetical protein